MAVECPQECHLAATLPGLLAALQAAVLVRGTLSSTHNPQLLAAPATHLHPPPTSLPHPPLRARPRPTRPAHRVTLLHHHDTDTHHPLQPTLLPVLVIVHLLLVTVQLVLDSMQVLAVLVDLVLNLLATGKYIHESGQSRSRDI